MTQAELIAIANQKKNAKSLRALRAGRDQWSRMSLAELEPLVSPEAKAMLAKYHPHIDDANRASYYRWCLRGLDPWLAQRKIGYSLSFSRGRSYDEADPSVAWDLAKQVIRGEITEAEMVEGLRENIEIDGGHDPQRR